VDPEADGLPEAEFLERYGEPDFERDPFRPLGPRGENWGQFMLRVGTTLDRIIRAYAGKTVVLVCHGGVVDGAFPFFFGLNTFALPPVGLYTHNTAITHWRLGERGGQPRWRLMRYNDDLHLYDGVIWRELKEVAEGDVSRAMPGPDEE
jgi:probable phosphoglycerate mutase